MTFTSSFTEQEPGDEKVGYVPHPMEVAREELLAAADLESDRLAPWLRRVARLLPKRAPLRKGGDSWLNVG